MRSGTALHSRPAATSPFHSNGVSSAKPCPAIAAWPSLAWFSRRMPGAAKHGFVGRHAIVGEPLLPPVVARVDAGSGAGRSCGSSLRPSLRSTARDAFRAGHRREVGFRTADAPPCPSQPPLPARIATSASPAAQVAQARCWSSSGPRGRDAPSGNAPSRHASQVLAKVCVVVIVSSDSSSSRWLANAASIASKALDSGGSSRCAERGQPGAALLAHEQAARRAAPRGSSPDRRPPPGSSPARPRRR